KELISLDSLRIQILRLRSQPAMSLRWGLYTGDTISEAAERAYFRQFNELILGKLNNVLLSDLRMVTAQPETGQTYAHIYESLKTHLAITSGRCATDPVLLIRVLKDAVTRSAPSASSDWLILAKAQVDFYARGLPGSNLHTINEDEFATRQARE